MIDTGQAILVDLLTNKAGTFLVSRLPLRDAGGVVIGAIGLVLLDHPETTMQPLIGKFSRLQRELDDARRQLAAHLTGERRSTHTIASRDGKFRIADGGTLLLDEIGDMPLALQSKLLRVLQEQEVEPLGSNQVQRIDVRIIAATSRDLPAMVAAGTFRADLFYRLNVLPIRLPPLRESSGPTDPPHRFRRRPRIKPLPQAVAELEAGAIRDALVVTRGNKLAASRLLGISRATLYQKLPRVQPGPDAAFDGLNDLRAPESVSE